VRIKLQQSDAGRVELELPHPDGHRRALTLTELRGASGAIERGTSGGELRVRGVRAASAVVDQLEWPLSRGGRLATASPAGLAGLSLDLDVPGLSARGGDVAPLSGRGALTRASARAVHLELGSAGRLVLDLDARASTLEISPERIGYATSDRIDLGNLQTALAGWLVRVSSAALERARADWSGSETLIGAGAAHLAGATLTSEGVTVEVDRIDMPEGMRTSGLALVIPELQVPEMRIAIDDVVAAVQRRLPARPTRAPSESGRFRFDFGFLDRITGRLDVDLTMELSVPVIGKREATHHFRIPIVGGALNYRELERDLAGVEDAFIDLEVRGKSLVIERRIPLIGLEKPLVVWELAPEELELAKKRLVQLRTIPRMQIVSGGGGEKGPITVRRLHFAGIEIELALAPAGGEADDALTGLSVANLKSRGELIYEAHGVTPRSGPSAATPGASGGEPQRENPPTRAYTAIERIGAGPFELALGRTRVQIERVEVDTVEAQVAFAGLRPRGARMAARGAVLRNLKIIAGALLLLAMLVGACGGDDDAPAQGADATRTSDGGPPGDARVGVDCREDQCRQDQLCCGELIEPRYFAYNCVLDDLAADCDQTFDCDGPEDCESGLCCGGTEIACAPVGERLCRDGAPVCHQDSDCPGGPCCPTPSGVVKECSC
jgi:hypothetical protein